MIEKPGAQGVEAILQEGKEGSLNEGSDGQEFGTALQGGKGRMVEWIDPETAEVKQVDGIQHVLITHCTKEPGFITEHATLLDAIFRTFGRTGM